jgi:hypothetical protein
MDLAAVPTPTHQPGRLLGVAAPTSVAPVALDDDFLATLQTPGVTGVGAPATSQRLAALRTVSPVPRCSLAQVPERLDETGGALDNVHRARGLLMPATQKVPEPKPFHLQAVHTPHACLQSPPTQAGTESLARRAFSVLPPLLATGPRAFWAGQLAERSHPPPLYLSHPPP